MIKEKLFKTYDKFHEEKKTIARNEMGQLKRILSDMGLDKNINNIQVNIDYEEDIFLSDAVTVKYTIELTGIDTVDYNIIKTLDNHIIRKYGKDNLNVRDIRMKLDFVGFEYLVRLYKNDDIK